jgi:hypothetical protein
MVAEYQFNILPCPIFAELASPRDEVTLQKALAALHARKFQEVVGILTPSLATPPFPRAVLNVIVDAVQRTVAIEQSRGDISRADRSALAPDARPYQDLIDKLFFRMAGLSDTEEKGLEDRLSRML